MDKEKVLTWLEICGKNNVCSGYCPYSENSIGEYGGCHESLMADAYDLLKEQEEQIKNRDESLEKAREEIKWLRGMLKKQEAELPNLMNDAKGIWNVCPNCGYVLKSAIYNPTATEMGKSFFHFPKFCEKCGQKVKWNEQNSIIYVNR